jgi:hypothetical protein
MATIKKLYSFDYTVKDEKGDKVKKSADAEATYFESISDAISFFEAQEAGKGEALLLAEINGALKSTAVANMRANLTRVPSIPKSIREKAAAKLDDNEKAAFNAIMAKLGISQL